MKPQRTTWAVAAMVALEVLAGPLVAIPTGNEAAPSYAIEQDAQHATWLGKHTVDGADHAAQAEIRAALDLYAKAQLELPVLYIYIHETRDGCAGHPGLYSQGGDMYRIDICLAHRAVVLHELAHAWEYHNVSDATRQALLARTGLPVWNDHKEPRPSRGIERAADVIAWGVASEPIQWMHRNVWAEELELYELLTGATSPRTTHWDDERARIQQAKGATVHPITVEFDIQRS